VYKVEECEAAFKQVPIQSYVMQINAFELNSWVGPLNQDIIVCGKFKRRIFGDSRYSQEM
jgi:hypothetical protein